jgi:hypothetical protein
LGFHFHRLAAGQQRDGVLQEELNWDDVAFVQQTTDLPLILEGALTSNIARKAI